MALVDEVRTRLSSDMLKQLTNPDNPAATSEGTDRLTAAVADAQAVFETITGVSIDSTNATHVAYFVPGVRMFLEDYLGISAESLEKRVVEWEKRLDRAAKALGRAMPYPRTNSNLVPSAGPAVRPVADRSRLADFIPNAPTTLARNGQQQD